MAIAGVSSLTGYGQIATPELLYYKFNEGSGSTTANDASSPVGTNPSSVTGLTLNGSGVFGSTALNASGGLSSTDYVNTGWATSLSGSWTISFWAYTTSAVSPFYYAGDDSANSLRIFTGGVAGSTGVSIRAGSIASTTITGATAGQYNHFAFVYDSTASTISGYLNGSLATSVNQSGPLSFSGSNFKVGGYSTSNSFRNQMDEFQLYSRALSGADVVDAMNANFISASPVPEASGSVAGIGLAMAGLYQLRRRKAAGRAVES